MHEQETWAQPIRPLACYFIAEAIRARRAEDEGRTEIGGGGERDSGDEETAALGRLETAVAPCSHIPWTLSALRDTHSASSPVVLHSGHLPSIFPPGKVKDSIS